VPVRRILPVFVFGPALAASCLLGVPAGSSTPLSSAATSSASVASPPGAIDAPTETVTLQGDVNQLRRAHDLAELEFPAALQQIALARALDLSSRGVLDHAEGPGGEAAVLPLLESEGYTGRLAEHLLVVTDPGPGLAATVMRAWFSDPAHRADLLDAGYRAAGIGIAQSREGWVVVQIMVEGRPQEVAP
jgi:uncharacterized protein YkwD